MSSSPTKRPNSVNYTTNTELYKELAPETSKIVYVKQRSESVVTCASCMELPPAESIESYLDNCNGEPFSGEKSNQVRSNPVKQCSNCLIKIDESEELKIELKKKDLVIKKLQEEVNRDRQMKLNYKLSGVSAGPGIPGSGYQASPLIQNLKAGRPKRQRTSVSFSKIEAKCVELDQMYHAVPHVTSDVTPISSHNSINSHPVPYSQNSSVKSDRKGAGGRGLSKTQDSRRHLRNDNKQKQQSKLLNLGEENHFSRESLGLGVDSKAKIKRKRSASPSHSPYSSRHSTTRRNVLNYGSTSFLKIAKTYTPDDSFEKLNVHDSNKSVSSNRDDHMIINYITNESAYPEEKILPPGAPGFKEEFTVVKSDTNTKQSKSALAVLLYNLKNLTKYNPDEGHTLYRYFWYENLPVYTGSRSAFLSKHLPHGQIANYLYIGYRTVVFLSVWVTALVKYSFTRMHFWESDFRRDWDFGNYLR